MCAFPVIPNEHKIWMYHVMATKLENLHKIFLHCHRKDTLHMLNPPTYTISHTFDQEYTYDVLSLTQTCTVWVYLKYDSPLSLHLFSTVVDGNQLRRKLTHWSTSGAQISFENVILEIRLIRFHASYTLIFNGN